MEASIGDEITMSLNIGLLTDPKSTSKSDHTALQRAFALIAKAVDMPLDQTAF